MICRRCGTEISDRRLACPTCHGLVHAEAVERLANEAKAARASGQVREEIAALREAVQLLPEGSRQHRLLGERIAALSDRLDAGDAGDDPSARRPPWRKAGAIGAVVLILWKSKAIVAFVLTKGKLLLGGLTKSSTLFSMFLAFGLYWSVFGWPFALGLVVSIYIHEMGHVAALRHYGIRASAPMFIPGLGAVVRLKQHPATVREDARVGLAGPVWGLGAALVAYALFLVTDAPIWAAITRLGAWINLFNLLPVWQLDGGRAFKALTRVDRLLVTGAMGGMFLATGEGLLVLLAIVAAAVSFGRGAPEKGDRFTLVQFLLLVVVLSLLSIVPVPIEGR